MPNAVFIPAELNDLSVDVALGTPAQGAVLYRGAAKWNALAAGGAGQVLTSGGINANPSWAPVSADLSAAVVLAPNSVDRNLIQPTAANVPAIFARPFTDNGDTFINIQNAGGTVSLFGVSAPTAGQVVGVASADDNDIPLLVFPNQVTNTGTQTEDLIGILNFDTGIFAQIRRWAIDGNSNMYWGDKTTTTGQKQASIVRSWVDSTNATRKARIIHNVYDTAAREALRLEADGTAARIGFLGAAAAVRQTLPAAATDPATTQTLANALRSLAITFGLAN